MGELWVSGPGAGDGLAGAIVTDPRTLAIGRAQYSMICALDGGIIDDLIVYFFSPTHYRIVVNAGTAEKDLAWMRLQAANYAVSLNARRDLAMIAIQGPEAREHFWAAFPVARAASVLLTPFQAATWSVDGIDWLIARTGYTGEDGFEIAIPAAQAEVVWQQLLAVGIRPCGLGARDTLRLEAGMNLYGQDMDASQNPLESGLTWTVDFKDPARDFIGKSALAGRQRSKTLLGLVLLDKGVLRAHQKVVTAHGAGEITSGSFSPTLNQSIALARLPLGVQPGETVDVEIRDKLLKAKVVKPPFVRNGQPLVALV
jgi:aminomethyltransferase